MSAKKNITQPLVPTYYLILLVFSCIPAVNFIAFNISESDFSVTRTLFYFLLIASFGFCFVWLIFHVTPSVSREFLALFYGLFIFVTFNGYMIDQFVFESLNNLTGITPRIRHVLLLYTLLVGICAALSLLISKSREFTTIVLAGFGVMLLLDVVNIGNSMIKLNNNYTKTEIEPISKYKADFLNEKSKDATAKPNVYFILPDMMFGQNMFAKYGLNKNILDGIRGKGFVSVNNAYANGPVTFFSLPHIFGMEYYLSHGDIISKEQLHGEIVKIFGQGNRVYSEFRKRGYKIYALDDGYLPSNCNIGEDRCITNTVKKLQNEQDYRFLERTPLIKTLDVIDMKFNIFSEPMNLWAYPNRSEIPDLLPKFPTTEEGPFFFYIHVGLPHYPLRFNADCEYSRYTDTATAYAEQYKCAVKYIELIIDKILESDDNPLVVIHSDHGVAIHNQHLKQVEELEYDEIQEVLSIYSAFRLPTECQAYLRDGLSPVNTFRIIFACLDNRKPELLEDRQFVVFYPKWPSGGKVREWEP